MISKQKLKKKATEAMSTAALIAATYFTTCQTKNSVREYLTDFNNDGIADLVREEVVGDPLVSLGLGNGQFARPFRVKPDDLLKNEAYRQYRYNKKPKKQYDTAKI